MLGLLTPAVRWWGRLEVVGLEHLPQTGPVLLAGNHDSYWDPVAVGIATVSTRQIKALAKSSLWKYPGTGRLLDNMGQIPIDRGRGDRRAMDAAAEALRGGAAIGVYPEGTRSLGRELRARSGLGRLARAVPEATILCVATTGTVDIPRFPFGRPHVRVEFFPPVSGPLQPEEREVALAQRLLAEIREKAPIAVAGRKRRRAAQRAAAEPDAPEPVSAD